MKSSGSTDSTEIQIRRVGITIRGIVQGVGFRPFVYRQASELGLSGFVRNVRGIVEIEAQGDSESIAKFLEHLTKRAPPQASIDAVETRELCAFHQCVDQLSRPSGQHFGQASLPPTQGNRFAILKSADSESGQERSSNQPAIPPDLAICKECLAEITHPNQRRFRYPFTNCTNCGPRYSIIEGLPYDRPLTSMKSFALCAECEAEYSNPIDRRFHAQPIACPNCGPKLWLVDAEGRELAQKDAALLAAAKSIAEGKIVAIKGLGGFQLLADATSRLAIERLRERKHREAKPFALMFPSLDSIRTHCSVSPDEEELLTSSRAPIVILSRRSRKPEPVSAEASIPTALAPGNPFIGAMLPYTPLHRLLLDEIGKPVICTSGNLSDEPMCVENSEALERLSDIADLFLVHDRPIVRPIDDSVVKVGFDGPIILRRASGYAPNQLELIPRAIPESAGQRTPRILAVGANLKATVAITLGNNAIVSQHLGDLDSAEGAALLGRTIDDLLHFYEISPEAIACDLHPDYSSTRLAQKLAELRNIPLIKVQHHHAHVAAVAAEHHLEGPILGLAWDGSGYGIDATIWGGEALAVTGGEFQRIATLRPFPLPGGDAAAREPRRAALGLLNSMDEGIARDWAEKHFAPKESAGLFAILAKKLNSPNTTSMGRLFDAFAALLELRQVNDFEGQAAMELEFAALETSTRANSAYSIPLARTEGTLAIADWEPMVRKLIVDLANGIDVSTIAANFHASLADLALSIAMHANIETVALAGGCFQNGLLSREVTRKLQGAGFKVFQNHKVPPNDGSISLGQAFVAAQVATKLALRS